MSPWKNVDFLTTMIGAFVALVIMMAAIFVGIYGDWTWLLLASVVSYLVGYGRQKTTGVMAVFLLISLSACHAQTGPITPRASPSACAWERAAVGATAAAVGALEASVESLPDDSASEVRIALDSARDVVALGRSAVALCDDARERPRWWQWAGDALAAVNAVAEGIKALGVPYAAEVAAAVTFVQSMLLAVAPPPISRHNPRVSTARATSLPLARVVDTDRRNSCFLFAESG